MGYVDSLNYPLSFPYTVKKRKLDPKALFGVFIWRFVITLYSSFFMS